MGSGFVGFISVLVWSSNAKPLSCRCLLPRTIDFQARVSLFALFDHDPARGLPGPGIDDQGSSKPKAVAVVPEALDAGGGVHPASPR
jgi:hypothetical protein